MHGCSLGAYHAVNIAMRHPHLFRKLAAFSGRYDLTINVEGFPDLFEGYYNEDVYFHTPTHFLPNRTCAQRLAHLRNMDVVLTIGESDPFRENNEVQESVKFSRHGLLDSLYQEALGREFVALLVALRKYNIKILEA